ncbi:MAG: hypothetical protein M1829_004257 [Trizodia sp. TS-e1964]|nr:MAG: hypothetical protein M1829_004257 [Trizodia sp. TS-e1964]
MASILSTTRAVAGLSFALNIGAQVFGSLTSPSIKDVHDGHISFFSPNPYLVGAFFALMLLVHGVWLHALCTLNTRQAQDEATASGMLAYAPVFVLGNLCLAAWMLCWTAEWLRVAEAFVAINALAQAWFVLARLPLLDLRSRTSVLVHLASKVAAGLALLDLLHNGSVAFFEDSLPGTAVKVAAGLGVVVLAGGSDWVLGAAVVYGLTALAVGQRAYSEDGAWALLLGGYAVGAALVVGIKNWMR